jgi:O-antigen/teichoic acid export membrane protein
MAWRMLTSTERIVKDEIRPVTQRIGMNSAWLLLSRLVVQGQLLVLTVLIARRLGDAGFGQYSLIASLLVLGNVFTTFGTDTLLIRHIAQSRRADGPELSAGLVLQLALSVLFIAGIWLWTAGLPQKSADFVTGLRLYSLSLFPLAFFSIYTAALRGYERMDLYLAANLCTAGVQLFAIWLALRMGSGLLGLLSVLLAVQVFSMLFSYGLCKAGLPAFALHWRIPRRSLAKILGAALPLAVLSIMGVAYQRLGIFSLSYLGNDALTGLFSAASRVVEALKLGHIAVLGALLPALSGMHKSLDLSSQSRAQAARLFRSICWGLLALGLVGAAGATLFARPLIVLLYGSGYSPAVPALQELAWTLVPYSLSAALTVNMISQGKEKKVTAALAASLAVGLVLYFLWVPVLGLAGACLAALAVECLQASILFVLNNLRPALP